jgi:hypothetical protein
MVASRRVIGTQKIHALMPLCPRFRRDNHSAPADGVASLRRLCRFPQHLEAPANDRSRRFPCVNKIVERVGMSLRYRLSASR